MCVSDIASVPLPESTLAGTRSSSIHTEPLGTVPPVCGGFSTLLFFPWRLSLKKLAHWSRGISHIRLCQLLSSLLSARSLRASRPWLHWCLGLGDLVVGLPCAL